MATDPGVEREIDLRRWVNAALAYWPVAVAGLVLGLLAGGLYALSGSASSYSASATIARGQAFNPSGNQTVLGYLSSPIAIQDFATSPTTLAKVAAKTGATVAQLAGHVVTSTFTAEGTPSPTNTGSTLVQITVTQKKPKVAEDAANALADLVKTATTSNYVLQSIKLYKVRLSDYAARIKTLQTRIDSLNAVLKNPAGLAPLDQLVVATQLDAAEAALGQTLDSQTTAQQQLTLAQDVETTQIIQLAKAQKNAASKSRRNAIVFGGLVGLLLGAILATALGLRAARPSAA